MKVRIGESSAPSTRIDIAVTPAPFSQDRDDGDEISDGLSAGLAAESNDLMGLSDSFSTANLNHQVVDNDLVSVDQVHSYPNLAEREGERRPSSSSNPAASTTTLRDSYMPPAPTPPQTRQRETTVRSRAEATHVSSPVGHINGCGEAFDERDDLPAQAERRSSPIQDRDSDVPPPRLEHLLSTLHSYLLYLTPPHLHPKLHHLLDPTTVAEQPHAQTFGPAIFSIRLAEVLLQVCAPRRDGMIIELVGNTCKEAGGGDGGSGGQMVTRR